jgi:hypothetical protein
MAGQRPVFVHETRRDGLRRERDAQDRSGPALAEPQQIRQLVGKGGVLTPVPRREFASRGLCGQASTMRIGG